MKISDFLSKRWGTLVTILAWGYVFQELVTHQSQQPTLFGRYSPSFFIVLIFFALLLLPLIWALIQPERALTLFRTAVSFVQKRAWLTLPLLALLVFVVVYYSPDGQLESFLESKHVFIFGSALAIPFLLLYRWREDGEPPVWRKIALGILIVAVVFEVGVQLLSIGRLLPAGFATEDGLNKPYGRLYDDVNGNRITNRDGWYSRAFGQQDGTYRILLLGDDAVFARDLPVEAHLDAVLEDRLGQQDIEVIAMGAPGFGPAQYYEGVELTIEYYQPDEIILLLNLPDDYLNMVPALNSRSPQSYVYYRFEEDGSVAIHPASYFPLHLLGHRYSEGVHPMRETLLLTVRSHLLGGKLINYLINNPGPEADEAGLTDIFYTESWSDDAGTSLELMVEMLKLSRSAAEEAGVELRIVALPGIPAERLDSLGQGDLSLAADSGLLQPERMLVEAAAAENLVVLSLGEMLVTNGIGAGELQDLFASPDCSCWTAAGYEWIADTLVALFYSQP